ncbi:hypothetical protein J7E71_08010 [Mesobacillus foraminis]|uniref:hypothetical protein n=1 Tax=Mesobacillus foraminis TaxID=279826 RepID=UPI001BE4E47C|nr:hypothetical protein [Mesobacillus foraminis]MBT2755890.1 hypothetical protein [Mesobacillus foraminis]
MTTTANEEIRKLLKKEKVHAWQVADALEIHENTFCKRMRKELSEEEKNVVYEVIQQLKEKRKDK